ncbi:MAG: prolipoprotein diacylglyceryl transferase [Dehalococcoidales bacterium]|nr:prolipoprotein diacylglyceryl transferase [Dehalococcoidales bacterium]
MNGIIININPVIFSLGSFELRWYSLAIMLGIIAAMFITVSESRRKGIPENEIFNLALWVVLAGIVGARVFHVIDQWSFYAANPSLSWQFQRGGLAIWGALVGGGIATVAYAKAKRLPLAKLLDAMIPGVLVAQIIGRFGCIVNGDAYGGMTNLPWAFIYVHPGALLPEYLMGVPTHPYPVYEIVWNGLALIGIWKLRGVFKKDGVLFLSYLPVYALGRFLLTFVRQEAVWFWGLQEAQVVAIGILVISMVLLVYWMKKPAIMPGDKDESAAVD